MITAKLINDDSDKYCEACNKFGDNGKYVALTITVGSMATSTNYCESCADKVRKALFEAMTFGIGGDL